MFYFWVQIWIRDKYMAWIQGHWWFAADECQIKLMSIIFAESPLQVIVITVDVIEVIGVCNTIYSFLFLIIPQFGVIGYSSNHCSLIISIIGARSFAWYSFLYRIILHFRLLVISSIHTTIGNAIIGVINDDIVIIIHLISDCALSNENMGKEIKVTLQPPLTSTGSPSSSRWSSLLSCMRGTLDFFHNVPSKCNLDHLWKGRRS